MPPKEYGASPVVNMIMSIISLLFMGGMVVGYLIMLITLWRTMKAHEKIADKLSDIADKMQTR